jgi:hypothetical protein
MNVTEKQTRTRGPKPGIPSRPHHLHQETRPKKTTVLPVALPQKSRDGGIYFFYFQSTLFSRTAIKC